MYIESPHINHNIMDNMDIEFQPTIDLQLYCCKFYNEEVEVKHTYLLSIPGQRDITTFRINFEQKIEQKSLRKTVDKMVEKRSKNHTLTTMTRSTKEKQRKKVKKLRDEYIKLKKE